MDNIEMMSKTNDNQKNETIERDQKMVNKVDKEKKEFPVALVGLCFVGLAVGFVGFQALVGHGILRDSDDAVRVSESESESLIKRKDGDVSLEKISAPGLIELRVKKDGEVENMYNAEIIVDSKEIEINSFDVILEYDTEVVTVNESQITLVDDNKFDVVLNSVDQVDGKVEVSGLASGNNVSSGEMIVGSFSFVMDGDFEDQIKVSFYGKGSENDSNLVDEKTGLDILGKVIPDGVGPDIKR